MAHYEGVLGTSLEFQVAGESERALEAAEQSALAEIDRLERIFNRYRDDSELALWERNGGSVSPELAEVLRRAEAWRVRTEGAFHPAVEALSRLWKDGVPPAQELAKIVEVLRLPLWTVQEDSAKRVTDLPANLNAIAKGYIIDRAAFAAKIEGIDTVLVNIGGDMRHVGRRAISVDITDPFHSGENERPLETVRLEGAALATSGMYRRGKHLFDPRTGLPVEQMVSASVIAEDALTADVLSTAFTVLHPCESVELADSLPSVALLLVDAGGSRTTNSLWSRSRILPDA